MMPDSSGSAKEYWGEKSVTDENERTPEVEPKSTSPRQEDKKLRQSHMFHRWFSLSNFYRGGTENGNNGHTLFSKTPPSYTALKWFHASYYSHLCGKKFSQFGGPKGGVSMPWKSWHNG